MVRFINYIMVFIILIVLLCLSCNYKLYVKKTDILYNENGYAMIINNAIFFVQDKDSTKDFEKILKKIDENTFWFGNNISYQQIESLKKISKSHIVHITDPIYTIQHDDTLYYSYLQIRGIPLDRKFEKASKYFDFEFNQSTYKVFYNYFPYQLYYIYPIKQEEKALYYKYLNTRLK